MDINHINFVLVHMQPVCLVGYVSYHRPNSSGIDDASFREYASKKGLRLTQRILNEFKWVYSVHVHLKVTY